MRRLLPPLLLGAALPLAACGSTQALKPAAGEQLPAAPYGAPATPTVADLLTPSVQERPQRNSEIMTRSQERQNDAFDLPPS
ncbi:MAG: hypothetical protein DI530_10290 [Sphingomonas sp.]|uniref:hypothetical protein n=1 Tax=Sphingomonas sp. TaxID=28214 RepID=UPI000DBBC04B|nr:hypothetical protein [Sphingomonas sp.]PZU78658.1 MAG: hypothetical protein DI530_10290 [Sphingomonas sp.]